MRLVVDPPAERFAVQSLLFPITVNVPFIESPVTVRV